MKTRALRIAVPVVVVCLVAGSIFAFFAGGGSLGGGEWKTAAGVSLPLPTDGAPKLVFTAQPAALKAATAGGRNQAAITDGTAPGPVAGGSPNPGAAPAGAALVITSPAVTGPATARPDLGPITVELVTAGGAPATTGVTVQLSSGSTAASEFSATPGGSPVTSIAIPPGASAATFYYGDEQAGQPVITAASAGVASGTQTETVTAARAAGLSFTDASVGNGQGSAPAEVTCTGTAGDSFSCAVSPAPPRGKARFMTARVLLIDQFRNPVTNSSGPDLDVTLTQTGGSSLSTGSVSIPAGASSSGSFTENLGGGQGHGTVSAAGAVGPGQATGSLTS